jgi:hypothetical protein
VREVGHIACMGIIINAYGIYVQKYNGGDNFGNLRVNGRIILKCILNIQCARVWSE